MLREAWSEGWRPSAMHCGMSNSDLFLQLRKSLAEKEASHSEQLEEAELRHGQLASELREAAEEAGLAAETASQNVEQWRRRYASPHHPPPSPFPSLQFTKRLVLAELQRSKKMALHTHSW